MSIIVCYATCWACKFGDHYDEPTQHTWMDDEDVECSSEAAHLRSLSRSELAAERPCACRCAGQAGGCRSL